MAACGNPEMRWSRRLRRGGCSEDWISELPDEILVSVLSYLTMKEAGKTCVLSRRWRYLWTYIPYLDFDAQKTLDFVDYYGATEERMKDKRGSYVNWVNQVIKSCNAPTLQVLRLRFDFDSSFESDIDGWVHFAMERKLTMFELILIDYDGTARANPYSFPPLRPNSVGFSGFSSLTVLKFDGLNVSGEILESFLSHCTFLETLHVYNSATLVNLRVTGQSLSLKHLELFIESGHFKSLQVSAPNLVSFYYFGPVISMPLEHTPMLVEASFGGPYGLHMLFNTSRLSRVLSQLQRLTLDVDLSVREGMGLFVFPVLENVKEFELIFEADDHSDLLGFISLIKAFPHLQKLSLKLAFMGNEEEPSGEAEEPSKAENGCHVNLKVVELCGYVGRKIDDELVWYFIKNAVSLEKLTLDLLDPDCAPECPCDREDMEQLEEQFEAARMHAKTFFSDILPPGLQLIII